MASTDSQLEQKFDKAVSLSESREQALKVPDGNMEPDHPQNASTQNVSYSFLFFSKCAFLDLSEDWIRFGIRISQPTNCDRKLSSTSKRSQFVQLLGILVLQETFKKQWSDQLWSSIKEWKKRFDRKFESIWIELQRLAQTLGKTFELGRVSGLQNIHEECSQNAKGYWHFLFQTWRSSYVGKQSRWWHLDHQG